LGKRLNWAGTLAVSTSVATRMSPASGVGRGLVV